MSEPESFNSKTYVLLCSASVGIYLNFKKIVRSVLNTIIFSVYKYII